MQKVKNALRMVNYSPQATATAACLVATAAAMWSLTDSCFACVLFNDNRDNRDNFSKEIFVLKTIGTIFYVSGETRPAHKKLSLLSFFSLRTAHYININELKTPTYVLQHKTS